MRGGRFALLRCDVVFFAISPCRRVPPLLQAFARLPGRSDPEPIRHPLAVENEGERLVLKAMDNGSAGRSLRLRGQKNLHFREHEA